MTTAPVPPQQTHPPQTGPRLSGPHLSGPHPGETSLQVESPVGRIEIRSNGAALISLTIERNGVLPGDSTHTAADTSAPSDAILDEARLQLRQYFTGERHEFELPLALPGTDFQRAVWSGLQMLPFGSTTSYGELGRVTGRSTAGRAVGGAVGANPIPIIIPCHRVLASNNKITGYSAGNGIPTKKWLLEHEGAPGFIRTEMLEL